MNTTNFNQALSKMILSASGWRGIFAKSGEEEDGTTEITVEHEAISAFMAQAYVDFIKKINPNPKIAIGIDARPTGVAIADSMIRVLLANGIKPMYLGITAAPEIMAFSHTVDGFIYISASHNPIGHNGVKFGKNDGGVIPGSEASVLAKDFLALCDVEDPIKKAEELSKCDENDVKDVYDNIPKYKKEAILFYEDFSTKVICGDADSKLIFGSIKETTNATPLSIVCDMNGSARTLSIDNSYFNKNGLGFYAINNEPGKIVHAIIPEPENLVYCADEMARLQKEGKKDAILGYMPDCDGDRGNIVFWNEKENKAEVLKAQEVFALSVLSELAFLAYSGKTGEGAKTAISVNDPTSMRIEEIASAFGTLVARAEVGEANVVNRARELRAEGYEVRILGEGSNGGNITHPAAVRDPLNSIFALIKLLAIKDSKTPDGSVKKGLFHLWCSLSNQEDKYKEDFSLIDVIETLPVYTTTGVSESRALLKITTTDHAVLKSKYQTVFENQWPTKKAYFEEKYGISEYEAICNNGTKETRNISDYSISGKGGLKILLKNNKKENLGFIWMRGSGTEPVFRVMCDVKGDNSEMEKELLQWHSEMILEADKA